MWYWPVSVVSLTSSKSLKSVPSLICVLVLGVLFFFCKCAMCVRGDKPGGRSCRGNKFLMTFKRKRIQKKDKLVLFISFGWCDYLFYLSIPCEQRCKEGDFLCLHITLRTDSRCKRLCIGVYQPTIGAFTLVRIYWPRHSCISQFTSPWYPGSLQLLI